MSYSLVEELLEKEIKEYNEYLSKKNEEELDFNKDCLDGLNNTKNILMALFSRFILVTNIYCHEEFEKIINRMKD